MCGPILIAFSRALGGAHGRSAGQGFFYYHAGRLWTYGMLGLLAGWAGSGLRQGSAEFGWQRPLAIFASVLVIASALAALGLIPGLRLDLSAKGGCLAGARRWPWLATLFNEPRASARLLLGAVMGLLPCGLIYAVLVLAATLPSPLHAALGMVCFGVGTLPALSALVLGGQLLPLRLRAGGSGLAAKLLLAVGLFMLARSLWMPMMHH
jgi:sulfite exporter TauE/SafE